MKFLSQVENNNEVPKSVKDALGDAFLSSIGIANPAPVLLLKISEKSDWAGFCHNEEFTEAGEIVLSHELVYPIKIPTVNTRSILHLYLHEFTHRLLPNQRHNLAFFALNLTLQTRASKKLEDKYYVERCNFYDVQDVALLDLQTAIPMAMQFVEKYADSTFTAEQLAKIAILELSYEKILDQKNYVPSLIEKIKMLEDALSEKKWIWFYCVLITHIFWFFMWLFFV